MSMHIERTRYWQAFGQRKHMILRIGFFRSSAAFWLKEVLGVTHYSGGWCDFGLWSRPGGECYCGKGVTSYLRFGLFGLYVNLWLTRDWTKRPCICQRVGWSMYPAEHADEIEAYGRERFNAEFPEPPAKDRRNKPADAR